MDRKRMENENGHRAKDGLMPSYRVSGTNNSGASANNNMPASTSSSSNFGGGGGTTTSSSKPTVTAVVGQRQRKRKSPSEVDVSMRQELEELREWRRRVEEREKQMNALFSASSSCSVCLDTRPDLISYGACGHMVCVPCTLDHVTRKLMVLRRRSQNTGCKARLSYFALNVEDTEFSCPICRQGQLDLMGAGLALLPDFAYYQLIAYCAKSLPQSKPAAVVLQSHSAPAPAATVAATAAAAAAATMLNALSAERRALVIAELERNRQSSQKALFQQQQPPHSTSTTSTNVPLVRIRCPFCNVCAAQPGETGADKLLPSELLRHVWRCKKRSFICGFEDCRRTFSWESTYQKHAPASVGVGGDFRTEQKWLSLVNAAFTEHMQKECLHMTQCCIGWCDAHRTPATIPLCQFQEHEKRHKLIHDRFQGIATIADKAITLEKTLAAVLRAEFNLIPTLVATTITTTTPSTTITTATATGGVTSLGPPPTITIINPTLASLPLIPPVPATHNALPTTLVAVGGVGGAGGVLEVVHPMAREVHNSLDVLGDLLRTYIAQSTSSNGNGNGNGGGSVSGDTRRGVMDLVGSLVLRCPLHDDGTAQPPSGATNGVPRPRPRTRLERLERALGSLAEADGPFHDVFADRDENAASGTSGSTSPDVTDEEDADQNHDDDDDDDDEDYVPDTHNHDDDD
jgi:hypothetical protein